MRKKLLHIATLALLALLGIAPALAAGTANPTLRVGLAYGSEALTAANLLNSDGYGSGYRFGYFDSGLEFVELGRTEQTAITMLRASQLYRSGSAYVTNRPSGGYESIGCYHVVLDEVRDFEDALEEARRYDGGFVAWVDGGYQVRQGTYETAAEAREAMGRLGGLAVKGTSAYAVNVVRTGTAQMLFQFDGGGGLALGVMPDLAGAREARTWFKGYRYAGGFRYERIGGGDLTVVNIVDMEQYIKGVIPYEMTNSWPLEALKAQAVCARSYAWNNVGESRHSAYHFDLCTTEDCQVYRGIGSGVTSYQANALTDRAVEETEGEYGLYNGEPIVAYYSSSHGGGSERIDNVWNAKYLPYLCGVTDPYEQLVSGLNPKSYWTVSYTKAQLTQRLQAQGFGVGTTVSSLELTYSPTGNVIQVKVNYENGRSSTFTPKLDWGVRSLFGVSSLHFTVNGQAASAGAETAVSGGVVSTSGGIPVNGGEAVEEDSRVYILSGSGQTSRAYLDDGLYIITGTGSVAGLEAGAADSAAGGRTSVPTGTVVTVAGDRFVVEGAGNGHQLGMSQYGAYAMAQEGFGYDEIVAFYFPGAVVGKMRG